MPQALTGISSGSSLDACFEPGLEPVSSLDPLFEPGAADSLDPLFAATSSLVDPLLTRPGSSLDPFFADTSSLDPLFERPASSLDPLFATSSLDPLLARPGSSLEPFLVGLASLGSSFDPFPCLHKFARCCQAPSLQVYGPTPEVRVQVPQSHTSFRPFALQLLNACM